MPPQFELEIIYGITKTLATSEDATIMAVKVGGMGLFDLASSEAGNYILRTKIRGKDEQLDEAKTVADYGMHRNQKVTLAAGSPFGLR